MGRDVRPALLLLLAAAPALTVERQVVPADQGPHAAPVVFADGGVYAIGTNGSVGALPPYGGWETGLRLLLQPRAGVALGDGLLVLTDVFRDRLVAYRRDGTLAWRVDAPGRVGSLATLGDSIVAHGEGGTLLLLGDDGQQVSVEETGIHPTAWHNRPVAVPQGGLLVAGVDGEGAGVLALRNPGEGEAWRAEIGGRVMSAPALLGDTVVVKVEGDGLEVVLLSIADGVEVSRHSFGQVEDLSRSGLAANSSHAFVPVGRGVLAVRPDGGIDWAFQAGGAVSEPAAGHGLVAIGVRAGRDETVSGVVFVDAATGQPVLAKHVPGGVEAAPAVTEDGFVVVGLNGRAYAFSVE